MYRVEQQSLLIREEQIITPLVEVFEDVTPKTDRNKLPDPQCSISLKDSLDSLFPEQQYEEKNIQKAREALGTLVNELTSEQLKDTMTEVEYLAESWLDDFEREIFDGLTLKELLHEKGRL